MPARLIPLDKGPSILLDRPILLIGRHSECDIQLESSRISRRHCCIAEINLTLIVRDLDSTNGIRINGGRVKEGRLRPGDELTIGNLRYRVRWDSMIMKLPQSVEGAAAAGVRQPIPADQLFSCDLPIPLREPDADERERLDESSVHPVTP